MLFLGLVSLLCKCRLLGGMASGQLLQQVEHFVTAFRLFDCAAHPEIVFDLVKVTPPATPIVGDTQTFTVTGNLTFNNVAKEFTFPVSVTSDGGFSADFKFDTTFFNFKYVGIDKEVRIQFAGEIK